MRYPAERRAAVVLLWYIRSGLGLMAYIARLSACSIGHFRPAARRGRPAMGSRRRSTTAIGVLQHGQPSHSARRPRHGTDQLLAGADATIAAVFDHEITVGKLTR